MDDELLSLMRMVDTPTVCNAIEVAQGKRGFDGFTRGTVVSSAPTARPVVGYARTAKIAAAAPSTEGPAVIKARRMDYYRHMASGDPPSVGSSRTWIIPIASAPSGARSTRPSIADWAFAVC
ncbi:hypothetical protein [Sinorhizobium medicae]|uniref:hypothetical protein n=1 Tax=Sinorhizobium medicae TaxID=110321 RepID=UPI001F1AA489|nr:hypothetical protein [Sinorhizobium medicae]